jgi:hypothetical protein
MIWMPRVAAALPTFLVAVGDSPLWGRGEQKLVLQGRSAAK